MEAGETGVRVEDPPGQADCLVFELERFVWTAPDRLHVAGRFAGLKDVAHQPTLVVEGPHGTHLLPLADEGQSPSPVDGVSWHASFRWQQAPVVFERAELHLSPDVNFELGEPYADAPSGLRRLLRPRQRIRASRRRGLTDTPQAIVARTPVAATDPSQVEANSEEQPPQHKGRSGSEAIRPELDAELNATSERLRDLHASVRRTQKELEATREELEATRADLEASRRHTASEAERFRTGLAAIRATAADALALEQRAAEEIQLRLNEAHERIAAREAEARRLRGALEDAEDARARAEADARSAVESLRTELAELRRNEEHSRAQAETAEAAASEAHREAEALQVLVNRIRDALGDVR